MSRLLKLLRAIIKQDAEKADVLTQLGIVQMMMEDLGSSVKSLQQALALEPENENARYHLAMAKLMCRGRDEAEKRISATFNVECSLY